MKLVSTLLLASGFCAAMASNSVASSSSSSSTSSSSSSSMSTGTYLWYLMLNGLNAVDDLSGRGCNDCNKQCGPGEHRELSDNTWTSSTSANSWGSTTSNTWANVENSSSSSSSSKTKPTCEKRCCVHHLPAIPKPKPKPSPKTTSTNFENTKKL